MAKKSVSKGAGAIRRKVRYSYQCPVCRKEYDTLKEAKVCSRLPLEPARFKVGQFVAANEQYLCRRCGLYVPRGLVTRIIGPMCGNLVNEAGERRMCTGGHVYLYELDYQCGCLKKKESMQFWTSELSAVTLDPFAIAAETARKVAEPYDEAFQRALKSK